MARSDRASSELVAAAEALDAALDRFTALTETIRRTPLTSQKNLERAARSFCDVAALSDRLGGEMRTLIAALEAARERQAAEARAIEACAEAFQARTAAFQALLARYAALGEEAAALNARMQEVAAPTPGAPPLADGDRRRALGEVHERLMRLADGAQALATAAGAESFEELARQATSLREQVLATGNRLHLLRASLD
ncbi:MAG TPA: hypothetical protein VFD84_14795 [Candidatus Binatia bacterium]|jgi:hypothetical protein|nr:hypothetical protein [Candidatus Binatia bacterium]